MLVPRSATPSLPSPIFTTTAPPEVFTTQPSPAPSTSTSRPNTAPSPPVSTPAPARPKTSPASLLRLSTVRSTPSPLPTTFPTTSPPPPRRTSQPTTSLPRVLGTTPLPSSPPSSSSPTRASSSAREDSKNWLGFKFQRHNKDFKVCFTAVPANFLIVLAIVILGVSFKLIEFDVCLSSSQEKRRATLKDIEAQHDDESLPRVKFPIKCPSYTCSCTSSKQKQVLVHQHHAKCSRRGMVTCRQQRAPEISGASCPSRRWSSEEGLSQSWTSFRKFSTNFPTPRKAGSDGCLTGQGNCCCICSSQFDVRIKFAELTFEHERRELTFRRRQRPKKVNQYIMQNKMFCFLNFLSFILGLRSS